MHMTTKLIAQSTTSQSKLWWAAIKPPMYTVAIIPITVGTAIAFAHTGTILLERYLTFLGAAILIIAWLNLSNDVFDADTGIDVNKHHSVVKLIGNKTFVFWLSNICLLLGIGGIILLCWWQQDLTVLGLISLCCFLGYTYQGPPFRLGYLGLGEIICFVTFGPGAITAAYYAQTGIFSASTAVVSTLIGTTTSIILFCSHFHQVKDDLAAGKRSPIVRFGTAAGAKLLSPLTYSFFVFTIVLIVCGYLPLTAALVFLSLPIARQLVQHVQKYHAEAHKVSNCKYIAVKLHFVSGLLLSIGLILPYI